MGVSFISLHTFLRMPPDFSLHKDADIASLYAHAQDLKQQGIDQRKQGCHSASKQTLRKALKLVQNYQALDMLHVRILHELAFTEEVQGNGRRAEVLYRQCLSLEEKLNDILGKGATLYQLAHLKHSQQQANQAIRFYKQALEMKRMANDIPGQAATLHQLAYLSTQENDVSSAIAYFEELQEIDAESGDQESQVAALYQMGCLLSEQGDIEAALTAYHTALRYITESDAISKAATLAQIARLEQQRGHLEQAASIYQRALAIAQKHNSDDAQAQQATIIHHLGEVIADLGKIDDAISLYRQALPLDDEPYGKAATLTAIGRLLAEQKRDFAQSLKCLRQALKLLDQIGSSDSEYVRTLIASVKEAAA